MLVELCIHLLLGHRVLEHDGTASGFGHGLAQILLVRRFAVIPAPVVIDERHPLSGLVGKLSLDHEVQQLTVEDLGFVVRDFASVFIL